MVSRSAGAEREAEQSWTSGAYVADVEVQGMLYDGAAEVSGTAIGKEPTGNRNSAGDVVTQEEEFRPQGKAPKHSGLGGGRTETRWDGGWGKAAGL